MTGKKKHLIIPIFIPHFGCPHQCVFCNQRLITQQESVFPDKKSIRAVIDQYLAYKGHRSRVELAFFGGNFLGLPARRIQMLLEAALPYAAEKKIDGFRFSTRPDTITPEKLDLIRPYPISMVELGVQSMNDDVLFAANRGHTAEDTIKAVHRLKERGYKTGAQLMVGLPGDNEPSLIQSAVTTAQLKVDGVRIYPLLVMVDSPLEIQYKKGEYLPLSLASSIRLVKKMVLIFNRCQIPVIRLGLQASDLMSDGKSVLAGPWHPAFGHLVFSGLMLDNAMKQLMSDPDLMVADTIGLHVHPKSESRMRGDKNDNMNQLSRRFDKKTFVIVRDKQIDPEDVKVVKYLL